MTKTTTRFRIPERIRSTVIDGSTILMDPVHEKYLGLNEVGTRIFTFVQEHGTADGLVEELGAEYDVSEETLRKDVERLLDELEERGLIEPIPS